MRDTRAPAAILMLLTTVMLACEEAPPPATPAHHAASAPVPATNPILEQQQQAMAEMKRAQDEAAQRIVDDQKAAAERLRRDQEAKAAAALAERRKLGEKCAASRPQRAADIQGRARSYVAWLNRVAPHLKTINATCDLVDTTGTRVEIQRDATGVTYRTKRVGAPDELRCTRPIPKGLSEDDVREALYRIHVEERPRDVGEGTPYLAENSECEAFDIEAGLVLDIKTNDTAAMKRLVEWKP